MKTDPFKLGFFVLLSIFLFCMLFIIFGVFDWTAEKVQASTFFTESVQGLEEGSLVKFRGVPIGKVSQITIAIQENLIRVDMEINLNKVRTQPKGRLLSKAISREEFLKCFQEELRKGLCARLELNGISGYKYVELDYRPKDMPPLKYYREPGYQNGIFHLPSEPSMLAGLRYGLSEVVAKIASVDYQVLAEKIQQVLDSAKSIMDDPNLRKIMQNSEALTKNLNTTIGNFNTSFTPERLDLLARNLTDTMEQVRKITVELEKLLKEAEIPETARTFRRSADSVTDMRNLIRDSLSKANETMDMLKELLRTLETHPDSLLRGKKEQKR